MTRRFVRLAIACAVLAIASACGAPRIRIERTRPAVFQLSRSQPIAVEVQLDNPKNGDDVATDVMVAGLRLTQGQVLTKHLAVEPVRSEFASELRKAQYTVASGRDAALELRLVPVDWNYEVKGPDEIWAGSGRLVVKLQILDALDPDAPPRYQGTYRATGEARTLGEPEAMTDAARNVAIRFLRDLQPYRVSDVVELDDEDPAAKPGIELCREGDFDAAYTAFADTVAHHPNSAPALYNLGVLAESRGKYDEAEAVLSKATRINAKPIYHQALERVRLARRDSEVLQQQGD